MTTFEKSHPIKSQYRRQQWAKTQTSCACCGGTYMLQTHHLVKCGRSDEECNLLRLCERCHRLAEGERIRVDAELLPTLSLGMCLALKFESDPENWNPDRLEQLYHRRLPFPEVVPGVLRSY